MAKEIDELLGIMARLRDKETGCPWDIEQDFKSIAPCAIEEAYEVVEAISRGDMDHLKEELGDLLLQVVFHAQMAKEQNLFSFEDVARGICQKLVSRHPHVFGNETASDAAEVLEIWQSAKDKEKSRQGPSSGSFQSILDDVPLAMPALMRAQKLSKKAARVGFEWQNIDGVFEKIVEELNEFRTELLADNKEKQREELGDLLFTMVQLGRYLDIDTEDAMRKCNDKFYRRFSGMEQDIKFEDKEMPSISADEWEMYWQRQKSKEKLKA